MSEELANLLNLELAWHRTRFDIPDRVFVTNPYLIELIEQDLQAYLAGIREQIVRGYAPSPSGTCHEPKGKWQVRPGALLRLSDEVVFNALVGSSFPQITGRLQWSQGDPDVAYQLDNVSTAVRWVKRDFVIWQEWREKSLEKLKTAEFVLMADIAAFYENIDLPRLSSDLRSIGMQDEATKLLAACLNRWAEPRGKGIPQGRSASDILAKLYLDSIDHNLRNEGFSHLRYVDDVRIFCKDIREAKQALLKLSELLRLRGLNFQSAKTKIYRSDEALPRIDGVNRVIEHIHRELQQELESYAGSEYATVHELEALTAANPEHPPLEVLERAFRSHFIDAEDSEFNSTLFHYLLTRLGATGSDIALEFCTATLSKRPEETSHILRYLSKVDSMGRGDDRIFDYLETSDALYEHQSFLVLRSYFDQQRFPSRLVGYCRRVLRDASAQHYVRAYAFAILGEVGEGADLEFMEGVYPDASDEIQRATIICACRQMEAGRRNAFFGRARNDGNMEHRAALWARRV
jgi:hypothetical protein